ncbi:flagellar hook-length control protein FliK [Fundidesulfovibrio terrae]|uniref:flagellar hook-length control protein FliK n=1 Tax=Fundidesulfovibrio terrae TaxID=2922866 RepID=UPI001FAF9207|nr:flagellar hook-length control protein FliK [Fundidesulfovibrio terrae]
MQIVPSQISPLNFLSLDMFQVPSLAGRGASYFADLLKPGGDTASASAMPQAALDTLANTAAPQIAQTSQVVSAKAAQLAEPEMPGEHLNESMSSVKLTQDDFDKLKDKLESAGVPKEKVEELGKKLQSPDGLTWGQLMQTVHKEVLAQATKPVNLTDEDKSAISSLLTKLGFDAKQSGEMIDAMASGKSGKVLNAIYAKIGTLDPDQTISLGKDEMAALGKALKLPDSTQQRLMAQFGNQDSLDITGDAAKQLFAQIKGEYAGVLSQAKDALKAAHDAIAPVMEQARERVGIAQQGLEAKTQADQFKTDHMVKDAQDGNAKPSQSQSQSQAKNQPGTGGQSDSGQVQKDPRQGTLGNQDSGGASSQKNSQGNAWSEFVAKVRTDTDSQLTSDGRLMAGAGLAGQASSAAAATLAKGADTQVLKAQSTQFLDQVQTGLLKNMGQGVKQLSLELTPDNLGKLNVVLSVKGKDVQAVIKAESPEAEKMLSENLQQIKQSLENQGLTVSKLEVRTGLSQDSGLGQQWGGAEKHNLSQERREALERMRTSSILSGDGGGLARQMQSSGAEVKISQGGLNIIA